LLKLRRLLYEANSDGHPLQPGLIVSADIPVARPPRLKPPGPGPNTLRDLVGFRILAYQIASFGVVYIKPILRPPAVRVRRTLVFRALRKKPTE
jgi:hypothetical protein